MENHERIETSEEKKSTENISKISEIKARLSAEIQNVERNMTQISKMKQDSIEKIEIKKKELRELTGAAEVCKEKELTQQELHITSKEIEQRKMSITLLDQTIIKLDKQIAKIQSEHDKAVAELEIKKRKLNGQLKYYDDLNMRLTELLNLLQKESKEHGEKLNALLRQRSELLKRTDLSETTLNKMLNEIDAQIDTLNREHELIMEAINKKLSESEVGEKLFEKELERMLVALDDEELLLTEEQIKELQDFEQRLQLKLHPTMTKEERLTLLRKGLQITPSGRIITKDDRIITLREAMLLGLLGDDDGEEEEETEILEKEAPEKIDMKGLFYASTPSEISSSEKSSLESSISTYDIEYLKRVFGKSLSLALAEITAVQPSDPIHYLAHWFLKYRYNQEIDEVKRMELQELMIERERLEAERWHAELEEEARLAILEALFRAENIIIQQDYERMEMLEEFEGEYEGSAVPLNPLDMIL